MSYDIIYNKQFVKLNENAFIPMILSGSNNVISYDRSPRGRRSRDWSCHSYILRNGESKFYGSAETILANAQAIIDDIVSRNVGPDKYENNRVRTADEIKKSFGYFSSLAIGTQSTSKCTATMYYNLYKNGIKKALTIEELDKAGINLQFHVYEWSGWKFSIPIPEWNRRSIKTTAEFFQVLNEVELYQRECQVTEKGKVIDAEPTVFLDYGHWATEALKRLRKKPRRYVTGYEDHWQDHYFTLENDKGYLWKYTRGGYKYSWSHPMKHFKTEEEATKYRDKLIKKKRYNAESWRVKRINDRYNFNVPIYDEKPLTLK